MPNMIESLAQTRHAEHYSGRGASAPDRSARWHRSTRSRAGWWLVGLGLRLALPGRNLPADDRRLTGRRRGSIRGQVSGRRSTLRRVTLTGR